MPFPAGFLLGTANADHQVEAHDPAREDVWDLWERCQGLTPRGHATDFANRYEEDIANAAAMGLRIFRFSISWARIETANGVFDPSMLAHYRQIAKCVKHHNMQVMVTLHHFVWPIWLERDHGGMTGREFPDLFARYAQKIAHSFGDLVDWWITFNEPSQLTFGYIRPWWRSRYYMPPGLPRGAHVETEARALGQLIPNLFRAHARARHAIHKIHPAAKVGVNPLVTGFPGWLQKLMDWAACHRGLTEALFRFSRKSALILERSRADLVIAGIPDSEETLYECSDPYLLSRKVLLIRSGETACHPVDFQNRRIGSVAVGNTPSHWQRDLPATAKKVLFPDYREARAALKNGGIDAVYGDSLYLKPANHEDLRVLEMDSPQERIVVAAAHGHRDLLTKVNEAISRFRGDNASKLTRGASRPVSLHEVFGEINTASQNSNSPRGIRRIKRRGKIVIGLRTDAPHEERQLATWIAEEVLGDSKKLEIIPLLPAKRLLVLETKTRWLNWAWRFWGSVTLIANSSWWYLGISGRLPEELCPAEAIGAQDFVGLDYYWGLPTTRLHRFRSLEDAAHGKFLRAPVWPEGLIHALRRFHRWFPHQQLFVVENGCVPEADGITRLQYLQRHLAIAEQAIAENIPLAGFNVWSITSNREWGHPFDPNTDFGLYFVDLEKDPSLRRQSTEAVEFLRTIAQSIG